MSYRTPAEVVALAAQVLAVAAPEHRAAAPGAPVGLPPRGSSPASRAGLGAARWPSWPARRWRRWRRAGWPSSGPAVMLPELTRALDEAGLDPIDPRDPAGDGLAAGLVVLPADETNGLEFDSVIVVEPSLIAAVGDEPAGEGPPVATTRGLRTLYVALTRPTRRLDRRCTRSRCPSSCADLGIRALPGRDRRPRLAVGVFARRVD